MIPVQPVLLAHRLGAIPKGGLRDFNGARMILAEIVPRRQDTAGWAASDVTPGRG